MAIQWLEHKDAVKLGEFCSRVEIVSLKTVSRLFIKCVPLRISLPVVCVWLSLLYLNADAD